MNEQITKSGISTGIVIGIAVLVAIIFGGGSYVYVNNKAEKEKKDLNVQITELQSQVSNATTATTTTPSSSTSVTDETAGWKTYTDSVTGLSLKYPATWLVDKVSSYTDKGGSTDPDQKQIRILVESKNKFSDLSLSKLADEYITPKDKVTITNKTEVNLGKYKAVREFATFSDPDLANGYWYFADNLTNYFIFIIPEVSQLQEAESILATLDLGN